MDEVELFRFPSIDQGTFGALVINGSQIGYTLELPWNDNLPNISCIPLGSYVCKKRYSPNFKRNTYHVTNVNGRSSILIHSANFAGDTSFGWQTHLQGCIAIGSGYGSMKNKYGKMQHCIVGSWKAVKSFEEMMGFRDFMLHIKEV